MAAAIFIGVVAGSNYAPTKPANNLPIEMTYMNDAALESVDLFSLRSNLNTMKSENNYSLKVLDNCDTGSFEYLNTCNHYLQQVSIVQNRNAVTI